MDKHNDAMDAFWKKDLKPLPMKIKKNVFGYDEDDAFSTFWEMGKSKAPITNYQPLPKQKYVAAPPQVKVKYTPQQLAQLKFLQEKMNLERQRNNEIAARRSAQAAVAIIRGAAKTSAEAAKVAGKYSKIAVERVAATPAAQGAKNYLVENTKKYAKNASGFFQQHLRDTRKDAENASKEPVGLGGAIYKANKAAGKKSIYD